MGGAAVAVAVRFRAVVLGTAVFCSASDFLNATILFNMICSKGDLFRSCGFMGMQGQP